MEGQRDYKEEIKINKFNLFQEWLEQSERALYWGEQSAIANTMVNDIDLERKIMKARLGKQYRTALEESGRQAKDKVVEELIRTDPEYRTLTQQLIAAKEAAQILDSAKWNFMARKTNLEKIQEGIIIGLFADPREITKEQVDARINEAMEKRRRG